MRSNPDLVTAQACSASPLGQAEAARINGTLVYSNQSERLAKRPIRDTPPAAATSSALLRLGGRAFFRDFLSGAVGLQHRL
ncbi:MAG: hypothetical protein OXS32_07620, partial [Verrucomicrobiales bacterium]|nr:hypothetical protein [Verrucomicrobiales bacterium]